MTPGVLPTHYEISGARRAFSVTAIVLAVTAIAVLAVRLATELDLLRWWAPIVLLGGIVTADFASGLVHWIADTWGRDDMPVFGRALLVPFRVHHINPDDFARRSFVDTNGEVAAISVLMIAGFLLVPLDTAGGGAVALFGLTFCGFGMLTNQIHQWAHLERVPALVHRLQQIGLLLGRDEHARHHERPYDVRYCITTGWCNRPLEAVGFYRRCESVITRITGTRPRHDDRRYDARYGSVADAGN